MKCYFKWYNVNGEEETFPDEARKLFQKIREAGGGENWIIDRVLDNPDIVLGPEHIFKWAIGMDYEKVDYNIPIPISKHLLLFGLNEPREFNQAVYKRTYTTEKYDLHTNGYVDWLVGRVKEIGRSLSIY